MGELFPDRGPCVPVRLRWRPPARSDWLRVCACSGAPRWTPDVRPRPPLHPTPSAVFRAGSKDAGGGDWLRRSRPPGFSAPAAAAAAITELPAVSAGALVPTVRRFLARAGGRCPDRGVGLPACLPQREPELSAGVLGVRRR